MSNIRNFVIIAHIDHGKSTLADRLLEITGTVEKRLMKPQYLDQLELERERGITIKMAPVRMKYAPQNIADDTQNDAENEFLYKDVTYKIRGAVFEVRKFLGLGHKEIVYHNALAQEFRKRELHFESERSIGIFYDDKKVGSYQPDFIVEDKIIVELKALPELGRPQTEQLWSYLKGSNYKLALLINFGTKDIDIKRVVYDSARLRESALSLRKSAQVEYILNLIDTPGHSDFAYEVSRALAAVEGAVLLVDATQGIQAQTLANFENAKKVLRPGSGQAGLTIIGAVNKIDVATADQVSAAIKDLSNLLECSPADILKVSGKTGAGVEQLLEAVIEKAPPPPTYAERTQTNGEIGQRESAMSRALIFDSLYDEHKGVIAFVRVFSGQFTTSQVVRLAANEVEFKIKELGYFAPQLKPLQELASGEIGFIATGIKDPDVLKIGDTVCGQACVPLPGYQEPRPVVFVSFYPEDASKYDELKQALSKLRLTDSALKFEADFSEVLGRGFKGGFLGQLHFEITAERLEREFNVPTVHSFPSVAYKVRTQRDKDFIIITNPKDFPNDAVAVEEPIARVEMVAPPQYLGAILQLKEIFRFSKMETKTLNNKVIVTANLPLADLIRDLDDKLKSVSQGFASFHYELVGYEKADVQKLEVMVAEHLVPGLTRILPKKDIEREARFTVEKLKELLPRQQYVQALQAVAGGRIVARENIPAMKKDVTGYLYGGDRTRKMKLWKKQQRGKKKLKEMATQSKIKIPASVFKELLKK